MAQTYQAESSACPFPQITLNPKPRPLKSLALRILKDRGAFRDNTGKHMVVSQLSGTCTGGYRSYRGFRD